MKLKTFIWENTYTVNNKTGSWKQVKKQLPTYEPESHNESHAKAYMTYQNLSSLLFS